MRRGNCVGSSKGLVRYALSGRLLTALLCSSALTPAAVAQIALPEITVTAPSPILPSARPTGRTTDAATGPAADLDLRPIATEVFAPVTVITSQEIERQPGASIGDLTMSTPGVSGSGFAAGANRPIIRGVDNARVRIQENGVGAMDVSDIGEDHGVPIDPLAAQRIEIIRGPATLRWGSQAIGGVVSVENNRIPGLETRQGARGEVRGAFTSVDNGTEGAVMLEAREGPFAVHADFFKRFAGDYMTPRGRQANSVMRMQGASIGASYIFQNGYFGAAISHFESLYHVPGGEAAANRVRIDLRQTRLTSKSEVRTHGSYIDTVRFWFGAVDYKHDERAFDAGVDTVKGTFKNREVEGRVEAQLRPIDTSLGRWNSAVGVQFGKQEIGTAGEGANLLSPADASRVASYIFNELHLNNRLRFELAGRIESARVSGTAVTFPAGLLPDGNPLPETQRTRDFLPVSVSAGFLYQLPNDVVASVTAQAVQRAPTALELFARGPHEASGTFEIGNPNLRVERAQTIEFGLRRAKGAWRFDASVFHTRYNGYIAKRLTGNLCGEEFDDCGVETELRQVEFTQKDATFTGAELQTQLDIFPVGIGMLGVEAQADIVRARYTDGGVVPRIPPARIGGGIFWHGGGWFARVNLLHAFAQNRIAVGEETPTAGYNLLNAELSYRHKWNVFGAERELTIGVKGTNLLNDDIRLHSSFKKDEVLQPGRGGRLFATVRF
jgi:iron complex outermembrane receptor protein